MADLLMRMPVPYEPLRKNRFILRFPDELGIQEWWVSTTSRPKYTSDEVEIPFLNTSTFVIGRFKWESISVTFRDPIGPSATQALMEWVRLHSESVTGRQGYAAGYPTGVVVQKWILQGTQLNDADFSGLDYNSSDLAEIQCTLRFDRAINVF
jgi:hypothetical protein